MTSEISDGVTGVTAVITGLITTIVAQPLLMLFVAAGLIGVAVGIIRKLKHV